MACVGKAVVQQKVFEREMKCNRGARMGSAFDVCLPIRTVYFKSNYMYNTITYSSSFLDQGETS